MNRLLSKCFCLLLLWSLSYTVAYSKDTTLSEFQDYKESILNDFQTFKKINAEETKKYKTSLRKHWDSPELSSKTVWVDYSDDLYQKNRVDFAAGTISITRIQRKDTPKISIKEALIQLLTTSKKQAFEQDKLSQAIEKRSITEIKNVETATVKEELILLPLLTNEAQLTDSIVDKVAEKLLSKKKIAKYKDSRGQTVVTIQVPLTVVRHETPSVVVNTEDKKQKTDLPVKAEESFIRVLAGFFSIHPQPEMSLTERQKRLPKKAQVVAYYVNKQAQKHHVAEPLIYALIEAESAYNPMARSGVPAYGLMQIVPESAGLDATSKIFGKPKILAPSYLYDSENNIEIGVAYLHILYYNYLKSIKDPVSRLYCTIAAYNTGAGNVARAFISSRNIKKAAIKINKMTPEQVYQHLVLKLPYTETKRYLKKINKLLPKYRV